MLYEYTLSTERQRFYNIDSKIRAAVAENEVKEELL